MKKRIVCTLLALCLMLALAPMSVFAADAVAQVTVGDVVTQYTDFGEALAAAQANEGSTLKMLADYSGTINVTGGNFTFDATGHTVTTAMTISSGATVSIVGGSFVCLNVDLHVIDNKGTLNISDGRFASIRSRGSINISGNPDFFSEMSVQGGNFLINGGTFHNTSFFVNNGSINGGKMRMVTIFRDFVLADLMGEGYTLQYNGAWVDMTSQSCGSYFDTEHLVTVVKKPVPTATVRLSRDTVPYGLPVHLSVDDVSVLDGYSEADIVYSYRIDDGEWINLTKKPSGIELQLGNIGDHTVTVKLTLDGCAMEYSCSCRVTKLNPKIEKPEDLMAITGQTLADVTLPAGWSWQDDPATSVGEAGEHEFLATFTPEDTALYETVKDISLTVTVYPAICTVTYDPAQGEGSIPGGVKDYGVEYTLSSDVFTREGYVQVGWMDKEGYRFDLGGTYSRNQDVVLYPVWEEIVTITVPVKTTVKMGGNVAPEKAVFPLEVLYEDIREGVTVTGFVETNGVGTFSGALTITGPYSYVQEMLGGGVVVRQADMGEVGWTYDAGNWLVWLQEEPSAADLNNEIRTPEYSVLVAYLGTEEDEGGDNWELVPAEEMTFTNTYTIWKFDPADSPATGDDSHLGVWVGVLAVSGLALAAMLVLGLRKKKQA